MFGYAGKLLRVDLSARAIQVEDVPTDVALNYLGGKGLAARILYDEVSAGTDALSPDNKLIFATGPLVGTVVPTASRCHVAAKSPLTGIWGDSSISGSLGRQIKGAGFDAIIIQGKADSPVYLWICDGRAEIRDATHLWGRDTGETQAAILRDVGRATVASIGIGGENLVRYACILSELKHAAGRTGMGTVMGGKQLKAIAVQGNRRVEVADKGRLLAVAKELYDDLRNSPACESLSFYGTWNSIAPLQTNGILPTRNFRTGCFEQADEIDGDALMAKIWIGHRTCPTCPVHCRRVVRIESPSVYGGPQYESVAALGPLCMNGDAVAIARANEMCNRYGLDTISVGVCIAFAMECYERGIDLGMDIPWGDAQVICTLIEQIARREGTGTLLADGVRSAAARIGRGSNSWALEIKGMELPMHDPRGKKGQGLSFATSNRGACHMQALHDEVFMRPHALPALGFTEPMQRTEYLGKAEVVKKTQDYWGSLPDSLGVCRFVMIPPRPFTPERLVQLTRLVTSWDVTLQDLLIAGERVFTLARLFNTREGVRRKDDKLPARLAEPLPEGGSEGETFAARDLSLLLDEYYSLRGWDENGVPRAETLRRLGLSEETV